MPRNLDIKLENKIRIGFAYNEKTNAGGMVYFRKGRVSYNITDVSLITKAYSSTIAGLIQATSDMREIFQTPPWTYFVACNYFKIVECTGELFFSPSPEALKVSETLYNHYLNKQQINNERKS